VEWTGRARERGEKSGLKEKRRGGAFFESSEGKRSQG